MKNLFLLLLPFCFSLFSFGQTPKTISYQGVARNATGQPIPNQSIKIKLSLLETATSSTSLYTETHTLTTSGQGLFALQIGSGTVLSGTYANLDWSNGPKFVKTEIDPTGGDNFTLSSTNPLNAVPFALFAQNGDREVTLTGQGATTISGTYPNFVIRSKDSVGTYQPGIGLELNGNTFAGKVNDPIWNANKLQGRTIDPTVPTNKDVLKWNGSTWKSAKDSVNTYSAGTGINITSGLNISAKNDDPIWNAGKLQGKNVAAPQPLKEDFLRYDGTKWVPGKAIPSYTTRQRDSIPIGTIQPGFIFYNKNTECFEYLSSNGWKALCGEEGEIGDTLKASDLKVYGETKRRFIGPPGLSLFDSPIEVNPNVFYFIGGITTAPACQGVSNRRLYKFDLRSFQLTDIASAANLFSTINAGIIDRFYFKGKLHFLGQNGVDKVQMTLFDLATNVWSTADITLTNSTFTTWIYNGVGRGVQVDSLVYGTGREHSTNNLIWYKLNLNNYSFVQYYPSGYPISYNPNLATGNSNYLNGKVLFSLPFGLLGNEGRRLVMLDLANDSISILSTGWNEISIGTPIFERGRNFWWHTGSVPRKEIVYNPEISLFKEGELFNPKSPQFQIGRRYFYTTRDDNQCSTILWEVKY